MADEERCAVCGKPLAETSGGVMQELHDKAGRHVVYYCFYHNPNPGRRVESMSREEMAELFRGATKSRLPEDVLYRLIHEAGEAGLLEVQPEVEAFLSDPRAELRNIALSVLTLLWGFREHAKTAADMLRHDPDEDVRMLAATALGAMMKKTENWPTLELLARVARDERENPYVRLSAFDGMLNVLGRPRRSVPPLPPFPDMTDQRERALVFAELLASHTQQQLGSIDWGLVDSYISSDS